MRTRIIIHYADGSTYTGEWDEPIDFKTLANKPISSLQIQQDNNIYHTLSSKKKRYDTFWQRDFIKENNIENRSILRKLNKDVWVDLNVDYITGKRKITIIREDIKVK